jgi:putative oxidoreductase
MRYASLIARYLLGLMFTVFGLNGFLNFIKQPPPTNPLAIHFFTGVAVSHYSYMFFAFQLVAGLLLLSGYFVPLALVVLAAEIINILTFHLTMDPNGIAPGLVAGVLWLLVFAEYHGSFTGLFQAKPTTAA